MEEIYEDIIPKQFEIINKYCAGFIFYQEEKDSYRIRTSSKHAKDVIS